MSRPLTIAAGGGTITVSPAALDQLVQRAAEQVEGVRVRRPRRGLAVEAAEGQARVVVPLAVRFGTVLPEAAEEVQRRVAEALQAMCGLEPAAVDVRVEELTG